MKLILGGDLVDMIDFSNLDKEEVLMSNEKEKNVITPSRKLKVFISSICGNDKYDSVRAALKKEIESTQLADVYVFEKERASTLSAGSHYTFALEDSDVCIFLIDNKDGIREGVQKEIDIVNKHKIKSLYYFCDEESKEKTALEQSLIGAQHAKSRTIHCFSELSKEGARALIDDIISIYHYYCEGRFVLKDNEAQEDIYSMNMNHTETIQESNIPKTILKNVGKCSRYILNFILGHAMADNSKEVKNTGDIDEWCMQFLPVMLEAKSIKQFNTSMYLDVLNKQQEDSFFKVVEIRWKAIQAYFQGDVINCIDFLKEALRIAKNNNQPVWVVKDILIDLRNQENTSYNLSNKFVESKFQKELTNDEEELYYPILDRINNSFCEKIVNDLYKNKTKSPYSVELGNNLKQYCELIASAYVVSMYNGSLTHLLLFYSNIKKLLFHLSCKYDNWDFKRDMLKLAIWDGKEKEIKEIQETYPEILNNMTNDDAIAVLEFCNNRSVKYEKLNCQLLAFGTVGYYLSESNYKKYEKSIIDETIKWLNGKNPVFYIGETIFKSLSGIAYRISQETLVDICCMFIDKHYYRFYMSMFRFIAKHMDLRKMNDESSKKLVIYIENVIEDEKARDQIKYEPTFLITLRKQNPVITENLNHKVEKIFPQFYNSYYKLETCKDNDLLQFIDNYTKDIQNRNTNQGKGGVYHGYTKREIIIVKSILCENNIIVDDERLDTLIETVANTLLVSKEDITTKVDAVLLLIFIKIRYQNAFKRNESVYDELYKQRNKIIESNYFAFLSNVDKVALEIGLNFLFTTMEFDKYVEIWELMTYIQNDIATTILITQFIAEYMEIPENAFIPSKVKTLILQNTLQWLCSERLEVRWNATRILFTMSGDSDIENIVNRQLLRLID